MKKKLEPWNGELPPDLDVPEFKSLWATWLEYREEEIGALVSQRAGEMQLRQLKRMGPDRAVLALEWTMSNGWRGIYEPTKATEAPAGQREISVPIVRTDNYGSVLPNSVLRRAKLVIGKDDPIPLYITDVEAQRRNL